MERKKQNSIWYQPIASSCTHLQEESMQTAQAEAEKEVRLFADKSWLLLAVLNGFGILKGLSPPLGRDVGDSPRGHDLYLRHCGFFLVKIRSTGQLRLCTARSRKATAVPAATEIPPESHVRS